MKIVFVMDVENGSETQSIPLNVKHCWGKNQLVTYIPKYEDLFGNEEEEQVYISRIIEENLRRLQS